MSIILVQFINGLIPISFVGNSENVKEPYS